MRMQRYGFRSRVNGGVSPKLPGAPIPLHAFSSALEHAHGARDYFRTMETVFRFHLATRLRDNSTSPTG
ncbi:MAG: hypothetical protein IPI11_18420 [Haliscomenobacter sp.]|nr:hypothetical protein [Haliscomenobacter sp.]